MDETMQIVNTLGDWYMIGTYTYLRIYGTSNPLHILPKFILHKLNVIDIAYQTFAHGLVALLVKYEKSL